jgi:poly-gamma-glutamate synthesis protein (capsule biosynthesis protein)
LQKADYIPVWVHIYQQNGKKKYRVVAVEKAIYDFEHKKDGFLTAGDYRRLKEVWSETTGLLDKPEQDILARRFYQQTLQENTALK